MKNKGLKLEDGDNMTEEEKQLEKPEKQTKKKKTKKESNTNNNDILLQHNADDDPFIEYIQKDLKNFEDLNKFKNMKSLSLINQGVTSLEVKYHITL